MQDVGAETRPDVAALFEAARAARERAYAPYSGFRVGAALVDEAGAVAAMVAGGGRRIRAILVLGDGAERVTPCGACRQRIREFAAPDTPVHVAGPEGVRESFTLDALLPASFGPETLRAAG